MPAHQYVDRATGGVLTESLFGDRIVRFLYGRAREQAPALFRALTGKAANDLLGALHFDSPLAARLLGNRRFLERQGVDLGECLEDPATFTTPRQLFERKIRYWRCRPLAAERGTVVSPADSRVVVGCLAAGAALPLKGKFFEPGELLGGRRLWVEAFAEGEGAIFRLTPDKYHWNHVPAAGRVLEIYEVPGTFHSCHPRATVELATPLSKNRRTVTVIDTDVVGGTGVGRVAMVEVVALMIGAVEQAYCGERYDRPQAVRPGLFVAKGQPKSLYRPGSSTTVLLFEPGRVRFEADLEAHRVRLDVASLLSQGFGVPMVETEVAVRSAIACRREG
ncbi:MAG TPA: phosphatidylserine decarboxylase [Thermoanaerobaculia bacterium]|nr:phosphatidylserine decarboxylase [Thermoanaerobaculia bacterium]